MQTVALPRLRWIALLTDDLERTAGTAERELGVRRCWTDPEIGEFGMDNVLFALGDCFLEICTPIREDAWPARLLRRRGPGGLIALFQVAELETYRRRAAELGMRVSGEFPRRRFTAGTWEAMHLHPKDTGGLQISLDVCDPPEEFPFVDTDWRAASGRSDYTGFTGLHLQSATPDVMATRWGSLLGHDPEDGCVRLTDTAVTITAAAEPRVTTVELGCRRPDRATTFDLDSVRIDVVHRAAASGS